MGQVVYDSNIVIDMISPSSSGSPPARYRLFPTVDNSQPISTVNHSPLNLRTTKISADRNTDARSNIAATLRQARHEPQDTHPAFRKTDATAARAKPALTVNTTGMTPPATPSSSATTPSTTGLRSPTRSRFAHEQFPSPPTTTPVSPTSMYSQPSSPPSGLRRPGDTSKGPAAAHMSTKAKRLEADILAKTSKPVKRPSGGIASAAYGTLSPASLSAFSMEPAPVSTKSRADTKPARRVKRKPVPHQPSRKPSWHELRLRPSSPTLVDTFKEFDTSPRDPPPTPVGSRPPRQRRPGSRNKLREEPKSAWDSDESGGESDYDEKEGLVSRVRALGLGSARSSVDRSVKGSKKGDKKGKRGSSSWMEGLLCACDRSGRSRR